MLQVRGRHEAIQKIESQMIELAQLFQDLDTLVVQQEPAVTRIEQKGEEVTDNMGKANTEIDGAIVKARSRNRKKWWCLLICCMWNTLLILQVLTTDNSHLVLILIVIVIVVVVAVVVTNNNKPK